MAPFSWLESTRGFGPPSGLSEPAQYAVGSKTGGWRSRVQFESPPLWGGAVQRVANLRSGALQEPTQGLIESFGLLLHDDVAGVFDDTPVPAVAKSRQ